MLAATKPIGDTGALEVTDLDGFLAAKRDAIKPHLDADDVAWAEHGEAAQAAFDETGASLASLGGNCPVQAEGEVDGNHFYFRARGEEWQFHVAASDADIFSERELFYVEHDYGDGPFDAGWMPRHEALGFIVQAIGEFRAAQRTSAGTAETEGLRAKPAGLVSEADASDPFNPTPST